MPRLLLIIFLAIASLLNGQYNDNRVLVKIGNTEITVGEFQKRYELSPQLQRHIKGDDHGLKMELLKTLIAEKLWALEAENRGYDTTAIMTKTFKSLEKMYLRDALYRQEIMDKINITPQMIQEANFRSRFILNLHFLFSEDRNEIYSLYNTLNSGAEFDSVLAGRPEYYVQPDGYQAVFGQMTKEVEDELYKIKPGHYTKPFEAPEGWYIFKLVSVAEKPVPDAKQAEAELKNARKVLRETVEDSIYNDYHTKFFKGRHINSNTDLFWAFADKVIDRIKTKKANDNPSQRGKITLGEQDFLDIEKAIPADSLQMDFITFSKNPVTLKEFYRSFAFEGFYTFTTDADTISAQLNSRVKRFVEQELLAREAEGQNLQNYPEVKGDIKMWRDYYLSTLLRSSFRDSVEVTEADLRDQYERDNRISPAKVNIVEILVDDLDTVEKIFSELDNGADFRDLAVKYTKREWAKESRGEFGFFAVSAHGEIGRVAASLEIGEIFGPLETEQGYSVFKLIGKKEAGELPAEAKSFEEMKPELTKKVKEDKSFKNIINKTLQFADKYGVDINTELLDNIKTINYNMFVYKYFGFGGRTAAVPIITPFPHWYIPWKSGVKVLP